MKVNDSADMFSARRGTVRGAVRARFVVPDGSAQPVPSSFPAASELSVHNTLSFAAADVMAAAYGGDTRRVPKYIGFIYGNADSPALPPIERGMTMQSIRSMIEGIGGKANMQVDRFNRRPTVGDYESFGIQEDYLCGDSGDSSDSNDSNDSNDGRRYSGNVVEFHAMTRSGYDGFYANEIVSDGPYAGPLTKGMALYRAVLLGDGENPCEDPYTVLAMVDLRKNGVYRKKPEGYELALDWRVIFE